MVLVDVDSFLEDASVSSKTEASLELMFEELLETTRPYKILDTPPTQIVASSYYGNTMDNYNTAALRKTKRSSKVRKGSKSSVRVECNGTIGSLLSLPNIAESNSSDTESIERITQEKPRATLELLPEIVWDVKYAAYVSASGRVPRVAEADGLHRAKKVRFAEIHVEPPSSQKSTRSDGSTSSSTEDSSQNMGSSERPLEEGDALAFACLDGYGDSIFRLDQATSNRERRTSCCKTPTRKYSWRPLLLFLLFLICIVLLLAIAVKMVQRSQASVPEAVASNHTTTTVNPKPVPTAAPVVPPTRFPTRSPTLSPKAPLPEEEAAEPVVSSTRFPTRSPTLSPKAPLPEEEEVRKPLLFLNCGGPSIQDHSRLWESDRLYPEYTVHTSRTKGRTTDPLCQEYVDWLNHTTTSDDDLIRDGDFDALFCTERWFPSTDGGGYEIPVPEVGEYRVELYFLEGFHTASRQRVFNISVEDQVLRENYDIFVRAGGAGIPTKWTATVSVDDLSLSIYLRASIGNPNVNAIAVYQILEQ